MFSEKTIYFMVFGPPGHTHFQLQNVTMGDSVAPTEDLMCLTVNLSPPPNKPSFFPTMENLDDFINFISFSLEKKIHQEFSFSPNHSNNSLFVCLVGDFLFSSVGSLFQSPWPVANPTIPGAVEERAFGLVGGTEPQFRHAPWTFRHPSWGPKTSWFVGISEINQVR